jgi:purine-binding chemotaxis protein CheW
MVADAAACLVGSQRYLLPLKRVIEIAPMVRVTPIPTLSAPIRGYIQFRGLPIAVVDLAARIGLEAPAHERLDDHLVIVLLSDRTVALRVDRVTELVEYETAPEPLEASAQPLAGIVPGRDGCSVIVDLEALLDLEERCSVDQALDELAQNPQQPERRA